MNLTEPNDVDRLLQSTRRLWNEERRPTVIEDIESAFGWDHTYCLIVAKHLHDQADVIWTHDSDGRPALRPENPHIEALARRAAVMFIVASLTYAAIALAPLVQLDAVLINFGLALAVIAWFWILWIGFSEVGVVFGGNSVTVFVVLCIFSLAIVPMYFKKTWKPTLLLAVGVSIACLGVFLEADTVNVRLP